MSQAAGGVESGGAAPDENWANKMRHAVKEGAGSNGRAALLGAGASSKLSVLTRRPPSAAPSLMAKIRLRCVVLFHLSGMSKCALLWAVKLGDRVII